MKKKIGVCFLLVILLFSSYSNTFAAINQTYADEDTTSSDYSSVGNNSLVLEWVGGIVYELGAAVEKIGKKVMKIFTGSSTFPWADKIIFNAVPILDINFINPASGSFFEDSDGNTTTFGNIVRNLYFTVLSLSVGFISIIIGVVAIRLAVSSIASEKAKCKEAIANFLVCLVLLFTLHFLLSFMFYLNETMVSLASSILKDLMYDTTKEVMDEIDANEDEDNEQLLQNFIDANDDQCFIDSIPLIGDIWNAATSIIQGIGNTLGKLWAWATGNESTSDEVDVQTLETMYPSRQDYVDGLQDNETTINVAAYLLKNKYYRRTYFNWTSGTDGNSFSEGGIAGIARNICVTANDIVGIVDNGYKSIRSLYTSTMLITYNPSTGEAGPYRTVKQDTYDHLDEDAQTKFTSDTVDVTTKSTDENGNETTTTTTSEQKGAGNVEADPNAVDNTNYYTTMITSTALYYAYMEAWDEAKEEAEANDNEDLVLTYSLAMIYGEAYYKYVYQGEDKVETTANNFITALGEYFRDTSYYVDLDAGDWAPDTVNIISVFCYAIFIIQSLMFLVAYFKRFFYVVILSIFGPVVIVFDYIAKSI